MSADAKAFQMPDGSWAGIHDRQPTGANAIQVGPYELTDLLKQIEQEMSAQLRWSFREYPAGIGLVGYVA